MEDETVTLQCSKCLDFWDAPTDPEYSARVDENVCWECEPEGW